MSIYKKKITPSDDRSRKWFIPISTPTSAPPHSPGFALSPSLPVFSSSTKILLFQVLLEGDQQLGVESKKLKYKMSRAKKELL